MKIKTIFFLLFMASLSIGQQLTSRAVTDATGRIIPGVSIAVPLYLYEPVRSDLMQPNENNQLPDQQTDQPFYFYPENLSWIKLTTPVTQGAAIKGSVKYVEIIDIKLDVATVKVTRITGNQEIIENRILSEYAVRIHFNDGSTLELKPARIIANSDDTATYPAIVPGARYLFKSALDDNHTFGTGENYSIDGGLKLDYD
jgi:hypothetical protein